jgi:hypothetical protein
MKQTLWLLSGVVVVVVGVLVFWLLRPRQTQESCSFSGWKRTVGVELEAQVKDLDAIKSKIGISDSQVRDYDTLMKDYALKYDTACQDMRNGTMSPGEYACLRRNMTSALDEIRQFTQAVEAAKSLADAAAQKQVILTALDKLNAMSAASYKSNCTSAMDVNPKKLSFTGFVPERSVQITNIGNNDFIYSVTGLPECLDPKPISGGVAKGQTVSVALERTLLPVSTTPITFHIHTNLHDDAEVEIAIDADNASLWKRLGQEVRKRATATNGQVSVEDALAVVNGSIGAQSTIREPDRYVFASNALFEINEPAIAQRAIEIAGGKDPSILREPSALILQGLLASQRKDPNKALQFFAEAKDVASPTDASTKSVSNLLAGSVLLDQQKSAEAEKMLGEPYVLKSVAENPKLTSFSAIGISGVKDGSRVVALTSNLNQTLGSLSSKPQ